MEIIRQSFRFFLFLYRPVFVIFLGLNTALLSTIIILLSFFDKGGFLVHYIGKFWSRMNLFMSFVLVRVRGTENIEKNHPYVIMSNHQAHYDVFALIGYMPLQLRWVMKQELRSVPFFGFACERMGHIYVNRADREQSHQALAYLSAKFATGISATIFPECSRNPDGVLGPFKKGGFVMAIQNGIPVLPVTVNGGGKILPKGSMKVTPGVITITVHPPIPVDGYTYENKDALMEKVREAIGSGLDV